MVVKCYVCQKFKTKKDWKGGSAPNRLFSAPITAPIQNNFMGIHGKAFGGKR